MTAAFVGVGSNLDGPEARIRRALDDLGRLPRTRLSGASGLYRNPPMGPADQPDFVNAVAWLETDLVPLVLLDALQRLEARQGRRRGRHWGPRTLDLDLLSMGESRIASERLDLPHPGVAERAFVLVPWAEVAPDYLVPGLGRVADLASRCACEGLSRIAGPTTPEMP